MTSKLRFLNHFQLLRAARIAVRGLGHESDTTVPCASRASRSCRTSHFPGSLRWLTASALALGAPFVAEAATVQIDSVLSNNGSLNLIPSNVYYWDGTHTSSVQNYTITGNGQTITANGTGSWFNMNLGTQRTFSITNTIVNGNGYVSDRKGLFDKESSGNATLNLEGTTIGGYKVSSNIGTSNDIVDPATDTAAVFTVTGSGTVTINGGTAGVTFLNNMGAGSGGGAGKVYAGGAQLVFNGKVTFQGNSTGYYGGGMAIDGVGSSTETVTFNGPTYFIENHAEMYGGGYDVWGGSTGTSNTSWGSITTFANTVTFTNNYIWDDPGQEHGSLSYSWEGYSRRGGALNIGFVQGRADVIFQETTIFTGNHVIGINKNTAHTSSPFGGKDALGGALSAFAQNDLPNGYYNFIFEKAAIFDSNYAYAPYVGSAGVSVVGNSSRSGWGVGGAIMMQARRAILTLGPGSSLTNNYASTYGGGIYMLEGTINLNAATGGNILFRYNRQGVTFSPGATVHDFIPDAGSGTRNAVYFAGSSATDVIFNVSTTGVGKVEFYDPIYANGGATFNKTGTGEVIFYDFDSLTTGSTTTNLSGGYMRLALSGDEPSRTSLVYGHTGTGSVFNVTKTGSLVGERGSMLRSGTVNVSSNAAADKGGRILVDNPIVGDSWKFIIQAANFNMYDQGGLGGQGVLRVENSSGNLININTSGSFYIEAKDTHNESNPNSIFQMDSAVAGSGKLIKTGAGIYLIDSGAPNNAYTGGTQIDDGTIKLVRANTRRSSDGLASGGLVVNKNGQLLIRPEASGNYQINNVLAGHTTTGTGDIGGLIDVNLLDTSSVLTFTNAQNFDGTLHLENLTYQMVTSSTNAASLSKSRVEVGAGAYLKVPAAANGGDATSVLTEGFKFAGGKVLFQDFTVGSTMIGSTIRTNYLNVAGTGTVEVPDDADLSPFFGDGDTVVPLLQQDDYGLIRTLISDKVDSTPISVTGDASGVDLKYTNGTLISLDGVANLIQGGTHVANRYLRLDSGSVTVGPDVDGLYIGARLYRLDIFANQTATLSGDVASVIGGQDFKAQITGPGNLAIDAADRIILGQFSGASPNSYTGTTTVNSGTLAGGAVDVIASSPKLEVKPSAAFDTGGYAQTVNQLTGGGTVVASAPASGQPNAVLTLHNATTAENSTFSGALTGTAPITKTGGGTLTLSGTANTFGGALTVSGGVINVTGTLGTGGTDASFASAFSINNGTSLNFNLSSGNSQTFTGGSSKVVNLGGTLNLASDGNYIVASGATISGAGNVTKTGIGTLLVNGTISAPFALNAGTLAGTGILRSPVFAPGTTIAPGTNLSGYGDIGTIYFGENTSSSTAFDDIIYRLDLAPDAAKSSGSDRIVITGDTTFGVVGSNAIDMHFLTEWQNDGAYTILTTTGSLTTGDLRDTSFLIDGVAITDPRKGVRLKIVNEGGTNNLVLLTFLDNLAMYWDAPAGSGAIWDQLEANEIWRPSDHLDAGGPGSVADDQHFMNGDRVFFNDGALDGAQEHTVTVVAGGVHVYSMTVAGEDYYTFNGGKILGTAENSTIDPDDGYVVKLSIESSAGATFNNALEFPFIEVSGSAIFNKTVTGASYTDEDNNIIYPNGLLNVYGANGNVKISGDGNFTVGNIILQNAGNTLTFDRATAAPLTYSGVISGVGPVIKENGGTVTLEGPNSYTGSTHVVGGTLLVKEGLGNSGTTRNYGGDIRIERNAVLEFSPNSPSALPGSGRAQEISGVLHGKFLWDSGTNDYARDIHYNLIPQYGDDGVLRATNADLTISNVRNTFNGDIEVRNSSVRVTGTLGSFSETFDGNTPYVATYWLTNYQGNISLNDSTSSIEFAYAQEYQYLGGTLSGVAGSQVILNSGQHLYVAADTSQFYGHTDVQNGAFHINAASYGAPGTTGNFKVSSGASLRGGAGAVLNVNNLDMAVGSHLGVASGGFQVNIGETALANVKLATNISIIVDSSASVPVGTYSTHDGGPTHSGPASANGHTASVSFANASGNVFTGTNGVLLPNSVNLNVGISGYIPTEGAKNEYVLMDGLDVVGIVSASGMGSPSAAILSIFGGDGTLKIMGATYLLSFNQNKLIMTQETYATTIPEPSTYALAGGLGVLGFALWRRRKRKLAAMAAK